MASKNTKSVVIINPASAAGKTKERWHEMENVILQKKLSFDLRFTKAPGHATEIAREAIQNNAPTVIAVGGDGTISEVAAGFFDSKGRLIKKGSQNPTALGIIAAGSGSDLIRTLKIPKKPEAAIDILQKRNLLIMDMGKVIYTPESGKKTIRPFINIAEAGIGAEVIEHLEKQGKGWGGWIEYQLATFKGIFTYKNRELDIVLDGNKKISDKYLGVMVANGKYYGSGMMIAPNAEVDNGFFDVVTLGNFTKAKLILNSQKIRSGAHVKMDGVNVYRAKKVEIYSKEETKMEIDGELMGQTPASFEIVPQAIPVIIP